jgi:hypothetical protein
MKHEARSKKQEARSKKKQMIPQGLMHAVCWCCAPLDVDMGKLKAAEALLALPLPEHVEVHGGDGEGDGGEVDEEEDQSRRRGRRQDEEEEEDPTFVPGRLNNNDAPWEAEGSLVCGELLLRRRPRRPQRRPHEGLRAGLGHARPFSLSNSQESMTSTAVWAQLLCVLGTRPTFEHAVELFGKHAHPCTLVPKFLDWLVVTVGRFDACTKAVAGAMLHFDATACPFTTKSVRQSVDKFGDDAWKWWRWFQEVHLHCQAKLGKILTRLSASADSGLAT